MQDIAQPDIKHTENLLSRSQRFSNIRDRTEAIFAPLKTEDTVVQPTEFVSPPKWHLAHTTWFFETFFLKKIFENYRVFDPDFSFLFNSYYESVGERVVRNERSVMTRPEVSRILDFRKYVSSKVVEALENEDVSSDLLDVLELGLQHEMQHQELLLTDLKYILALNPLLPAYDQDCAIDTIEISDELSFIPVGAGNYNIGFSGEGFAFDNELSRHTVYLHDYEIANRPVSCGEFIEFIEDGGYENFRYWHSDAWAWINENKVSHPLYFHKDNGTWMQYTLGGYKRVDPNSVLMNISFYEASAFAKWKGMRLPTEAEWEVASDRFKWGEIWEWTNSAYLPYPGFKAAPGALGEYNGKFMVNQMVLRGASLATAEGQSRSSYRNFFHPHLQWQYAGIRLAR